MTGVPYCSRNRRQSSRRPRLVSRSHLRVPLLHRALNAAPAGRSLRLCRSLSCWPPQACCLQGLGVARRRHRRRSSTFPCAPRSRSAGSRSETSRSSSSRRSTSPGCLLRTPVAATDLSRFGAQPCLLPQRIRLWCPADRCVRCTRRTAALRIGFVLGAGADGVDRSRRCSLARTGSAMVAYAVAEGGFGVARRVEPALNAYLGGAGLAAHRRARGALRPRGHDSVASRPRASPSC